MRARIKQNPEGRWYHDFVGRVVEIAELPRDHWQNDWNYVVSRASVYELKNTEPQNEHWLRKDECKLFTKIDIIVKGDRIEHSIHPA